MNKGWHCSNCGSKDVTISATAHWDEAKQDWALCGVDDNDDNDYCNDCNDWHPGEFRDLTDLKAAAQAAIIANDTKYSEDNHGIPK